MKKVFDKVVEFDKQLSAKVKQKFGLSVYQMKWISFAKGFVIGAILL
jgi:hypothetical protein